MSRRIAYVAVILLSSVSLTACGRSPGERALTGGLIGAGAGAGVGAIAGGDPVTGALVGAGVGAVGGALTAPQRGYGRPAHYGRGNRPRDYRTY